MRRALVANVNVDMPFFTALEVQLSGQGVICFNKGDHLLVSMFQDGDLLKSLTALGWNVTKQTSPNGYYAVRDDGTYPMTILNGRGAWSVSAPL